MADQLRVMGVKRRSAYTEAAGDPSSISALLRFPVHDRILHS